MTDVTSVPDQVLPKSFTSDCLPKELEEICMSTKSRKRDYISPSDLTFLYGECKRCFWLKYNEGISTPGFMPLVGPLSAFQEAEYKNEPSSALDPQLPVGTIARWGQTVESKPIIINGKETAWRIKGKYDLVVEYTNGTIGLIDCKVTTSEMDDGKVNHYLPQLEAYCYALENPLEGNPEIVSHSGLMMWRINGATRDDEGDGYFSTRSGISHGPKGSRDVPQAYGRSRLSY
jgi:hypothetical protein